MRVAYAVHGYGRGHATRALALLPALARRHELLFFAGGDAYDLLSREADVERIPCLAYVYRGARIDWPRSVAANASFVADVLGRGADSRHAERLLARFRPDVVVSDTEALVLGAARRMRIPTVGLDHVGVIAHFRPPASGLDRAQLALDATFYRGLLHGADRLIVSSFYDAPPRHARVRRVPPILRERVLRATPTDGAHLLVYFNKGHHLYAPHVDAALQALGTPVVAYGTGRTGRRGNVVHRPIDEDGFVDDLASCAAVLATGGHQLIGEAIHLGKPLLVAPEASAEQRLNARELERLGYGRRIAHRDIDARAIRDFLASAGAFRAALRGARRPGNAEAIAVLETTLDELAAVNGPVHADDRA